MHRETLISCAPYLAAIVALLICQGLLLRLQPSATAVGSITAVASR